MINDTPAQIKTTDAQALRYLPCALDVQPLLSVDGLEEDICFCKAETFFTYFCSLHTFNRTYFSIVKHVNYYIISKNSR